MAICIYAPDATDFSTNGLGTLTPISCSVEEESGGMYELELTVDKKVIRKEICLRKNGNNQFEISC